jgi:hypothetical protein
LAIAAIDQDGTLKAYAEEEEKKRIMLGSSGGGCLGSAPKVPHGVHITRGIAAPTYATVLGQSPTVPVAAAAAATTVVPSWHYYTIAAGHCQATTAAYTCRVPMLQLQENRPFCQRLLPDQAGQFITSFSTHDEPPEGPVEGPSTVIQLS